MLILRVITVRLLIRHRHDSALQLAQSSVLTIYTATGAVVLGSCYLWLPTSDRHCYWLGVMPLYSRR